MKSHYDFQKQLDKLEKLEDSFKRISPLPRTQASSQLSPKLFTKTISTKNVENIDFQKQIQSIIQNEAKQQKMLQLNYKHKSIAGKLLNSLEDNLKLQLQQKQFLQDLLSNFEQNLQEQMAFAHSKYQNMTIQLQNYYHQTISNLKNLLQSKMLQIKKELSILDQNLAQIHIAAQNLTTSIDSSDPEIFKRHSNKILQGAEQASFIRYSQRYSHDFCNIENSYRFNAELNIQNELQSRSILNLAEQKQDERSFQSNEQEKPINEEIIQTQQMISNFYDDEEQQDEANGTDFNEQIESLEKEIHQLKVMSQNKHYSPPKVFSFDVDEEENNKGSQEEILRNFDQQKRDLARRKIDLSFEVPSKESKAIKNSALNSQFN